jgi:hypothetical protein
MQHASTAVEWTERARRPKAHDGCNSRGSAVCRDDGLTARGEASGSGDDAAKLKPGVMEAGSCAPVDVRRALDD